MKIHHIRVTLALCAGAMLAACGSSSSNPAQTSVGGNVTASSADSQVAQAAAQSPSNATTADNATIGQQGAVFFAVDDITRDVADNLWEADTAGTVSFNLYGCTASAAVSVANSNGTTTLDANVSVDPNSCAFIKMSGTDDIVATWSTSAATRTVSATEDFSITFRNSDTLTVMSLDSTQPSATLQVTGLAANGNTSSLVTINEHRHLANSSGQAIFDHNITTPTAVAVTTTFNTTGTTPVPATRVLTNAGEVDVHHNLAHFLAKHTFDNLTYQLNALPACYCPSSGTLTQTVILDNGKGGFTRTYTFTGCGVATVNTTASTLSGTSANATANITWENCTN